MYKGGGLSALAYTMIESPVGPLLAAGDDGALAILAFSTGRTVLKPGDDWVRDAGAFVEVERQLAAYFAGELKTFELALKFEGTDFQRRAWSALAEIPYGETWSYGEMAARLGNPKASRAVGAANGANPLPIVLPCHRVIGANGSLTGFGGGLDTKTFLLDHERQIVGGGGYQPRLI